MKPIDVAKLLGLGRSTVALWTSSEYRDYFSPSAQGGNDKRRNFTDLDVRIMYALKQLKEANTPAETIHQTLQRWRADDWQDLPDMPPAPANFASVAVVPAAAADAALSTERRALLREIAVLQERVEQLEDERRGDRADRDALLREIGDVRAALAESNMLLKLYRKRGRIEGDE